MDHDTPQQPEWAAFPSLAIPAPEEQEAMKAAMSPEDTVQGVYWQAENDRQLGLLQRYETHRYKPAACSIRLEQDERTIDDGLTFVWAGGPVNSELKHGEFLLQRYQLYFKPDAFKRKA